MERIDDNEAGQKNGRHENPLRSEIKDEEREQMKLAHDQAEQDIENDVDMSASSPNDDLDEGETALLGDDGAGLI